MIINTCSLGPVLSQYYPMQSLHHLAAALAIPHFTLTVSIGGFAENPEPQIVFSDYSPGMLRT